MKNFKKVLAVMTAVASMCMSASAFAAVEGSFVTPETNGVSGTFDYTNSTFTITSPASTGEVTILVLNPNVNDTNVQSGDIRYINQATGGNFGTMGLKLNPAVGETPAETNLPVGEYPVKVGYYKADGSFAIATATLSVADNSTGGTTIKIVIGDVNGAAYTGDATTNLSAVTAADAMAILNLSVGDSVSQGGVFDIGTVVECADGKKIVIGDVNGAAYTGDATTNLSAVTAADAMAILNLSVGDSVSQGGVFDIGTVVSVKAE